MSTGVAIFLALIACPERGAPPSSEAGARPPADAAAEAAPEDSGLADAASWRPDDMPSFEESAGVVLTAGGDAVGSLPPGPGGAVAFEMGADVGTDFAAATDDLSVAAGETLALAEGTHPFRHCTVDGALEIEGAVDLVCAGHLVVSASGRVVGRRGRAGADLVVHVQGTFAIDGVVDLAADEGEAGVEAQGLAGGSFTLRTTAPRSVAIPTIVTRGGDANFWDDGARGGDVEIRVAAGAEATVVVLSGARPWDAAFPPARMHARSRWFGPHEPGASCPPDCGTGWLDFETTLFRGGILTVGGVGGDAAEVEGPGLPGARGGRGGDVQIRVAEPHHLRFDHVDIVTGGSGAEQVGVHWSWDYGLAYTMASFSGGLGGTGGWGAVLDGGGGGDGGDGGAIAITATLEVAVEATEVPQFAWDGGSTAGALGTSGVFHVGRVAGDDDPIYVVSAAGGWGGAPGASATDSPGDDYPPRFGRAGEEGTLILELAGGGE